MKENIFYLARTFTYNGIPNITPWERIGNIFTEGTIFKKEIIDGIVVDHRFLLDIFDIKRFENLKWIASPNTSIEHLGHVPENIKIYSLVGKQKKLHQIKSVSEHVFNLIFRLIRPLNRFGQTLNNKTISIIGSGRIGVHVSQVARGFGMKVIYIDIDSKKKEWEDAFSTSDFVSIHLPLKESTKKIVNKNLLERMKPTSFFINTARGGVVDEQCLYDLILDFKIAGAGIDVFSSEEMRSKFLSSPKLRNVNVVISEHVGGSTYEDRLKTDQILIDEILSDKPTDMFPGLDKSM